MAEVELSRAEAEGKGRLPRVCMQCGAPATDEVAKQFTYPPAHPPAIPPDGFGCLLMPLWLLAELFRRAGAREMTVRTPLCRKHAHGWFAWSTLSPTSITDDAITLSGVSEHFIRALQEHRASRPPEVLPAGRPEVRVRCPKCRSLNDEAARFCNQCGAAL